MVDDKGLEQFPEDPRAVPRIWTISGELNDAYAAWLREFDGESDRACAVLGAAYLDQRLGDLLAALFVEGTASTKLLQGSLRGFWPRIEVCFAHGLIGDGERDDLHLMRRVRDQFAHGGAGLSFATEAVAHLCHQLSLIPKSLIPATGWRLDWDAIGRLMPLARAEFVMTAGFLAGLLNGTVAATQHHPGFRSLVRGGPGKAE